MTTATVKTWSPQQQAFFDFCLNTTSSCVLIAVAGAGKTTSIVEAAKRMAKKGLSIAMLAYNNKIAKELKDRVEGIDNIKAGTVHSFGNSALRSIAMKQKIRQNVERNKVANITESIVQDPELLQYKQSIVKMISFAKQRALGVIGRIDDRNAWNDIIEHFDVFADYYEQEKDRPIPIDQIIDNAIAVLKQNNRMIDVIDFDDMVYLPLILNLPFWRYDVVFVDEAQDTNPARRALVRALVKKGGRVIAVGDPAQAIYGFTGADSDSIEQIKRDFNAVELPLTVSYRCPKNVVAFAQQWVNHIQPFEKAQEGVVGFTSQEDFFKRNDLNGESAVLCRVTKPIVALAFSLIRRKIACKVEGREIGNGLKNLAQRWKVKTTDKLRDKLDAYLERETTKLLAKNQEDRVQAVEDMVETLKVIIENCESEGKHTVDCVISSIDKMFEDDVNGILVLSTIHKSKGREWKNVFWLDRAGTCPSKWARKAWQKEQEKNLMYVAATRSQGSLYDLV